MAEPDASIPSLEASQRRRPRKRRPALSCDPCIKRKVKCDRVSPCRACCLRGEASLCVFQLTPRNREAITQLDEINRLRAELDSLKAEQDSKSVVPASPQFSPHYDLPEKSDTLREQASDVFVERFVNSFSASTRYSWSGWIADVANETKSDQPILADALLSIAMARCGMLDGNYNIQLNGHNLYVNTLARLQGELYEPSRASRPEILYSTMLLSLYELVVLNNPISWLTHIHGVGRLIQHRGPERHMRGLEHKTFRFFRMFGVSLSVFLRQASFLSQPQWKNIPWAESYPSKDIYDLVVDNLVDLPTLLMMGDELQQVRARAGDDLHQKQQLAKLVQRFEQNLEKWRQDWVCSYPGMPTDLSPEHTETITAFSEICRPLISTDVRLAQVMNLYYAAHLLILRVSAGGESTLAFPPLELVRLICQTSELQLANELDYFAALAMLFPLRVAYFTPLGEPSFKNRVGNMFINIDKSFGLNFAPSILNVLPGFAGSISLEPQKVPVVMRSVTSVG